MTSINDLYKIQGKIALVTGGSRGLGLYIAEGFLLAGASKVYISSRKAKACEEAAKELNGLGLGQAIPLPGDVGNRPGVEKLLADFLKIESKLDILIANAGATWGEDFDKHPDSAFAKVMDLNVRGVFSTIQLFTPLLEKSGTAQSPSRIIVTGSVAGIRNGASGGTYGYLASKAAVHHLARTLAVELGPRHITVNVLAPGFFPSKMSNGLLEVVGDAMVEANPLGRLGVKNDIIGAVNYLVSPAANYVNGLVLVLDGGQNLVSRI